MNAQGEIIHTSANASVTLACTTISKPSVLLCLCLRLRQCMFSLGCKWLMLTLTLMSTSLVKTRLKEPYRNHNKSFNHKRTSNDTELSKYIWKLKELKQDFHKILLSNENSTLIGIRKELGILIVYSSYRNSLMQFSIID